MRDFLDTSPGQRTTRGCLQRAIRAHRRLLPAVLFLFLGTAPARGDLGRPAPERGPTRVIVTLYFLDVTGIESAAQSFTANLYLEARWRDERLAHTGATATTRNLEDVWSPRIQILNQRRLQKTFPDHVEIAPGGDVVYRQRFFGVFSQPLDLRRFPLDRHTFAVDVVSAGYSTEEVELVPDPDVTYGIAETLSLADWKVVGWTAEQVALPALRDNQRTRNLLRFSFEAKRRTGYFTITVIIPLIMIVAMSWMVFWIDPTQAGSQISVAVTAMLTLIAYRFAVRAELPKVSYLTRMDLFLLGATVLIFAGLLEVMVTSTLTRHEKLELARRIDLWCRALFPLAFALITWRAFLA